MAKKGNKKDFVKLQDDLDKILNKEEKEVDSFFKVFLDKVKIILSNFFESFYNKHVILDEGKVTHRNLLLKLLRSIYEIIQKLQKHQIRFTKKKKKDFFKESFYRYGYYIEKQVEEPVYRLLSDKEIEDKSSEPLNFVNWEDSVKNQTDSLKMKINSIVTEGLFQEKSYFEIAKRVTDEFNISSNRAKTIVRNECRKVQEMANIESMKESAKAGVITKKMWLSTLDTRTRDTHKHLDGQIKDVNDNFVTRSGLKAQAPHLFGVLKEDINCRCTMVSYIEGFEPKFRRSRDENGKGIIIPYVTYEKWFENLSSR